MSLFEHFIESDDIEYLSMQVIFHFATDNLVNKNNVQETHFS